MPILAEFKPDIIVNSAGQDNHFTDPLTNMHFSAQGYADLTALLKPHIAVLEGGYSIEGALPYVNVGIILAMAGVDYSKVKEPGYDHAKLRQSDQITRVIEDTCETVMANWKQQNVIREHMQKNKKFAERRRHIFYDTAGINETQYETLRICRNCGGVLKIDSKSDTGQHILGVHIPRKACGNCQDLGYEWYASAKPDHYQMVLMQDRVEDEYRIRQK